uniref:Uncharacterized protein n=1 Tax=Parascaris univalens TaxID=6257 RepID=A0A915AWP0_PARUN
SHPLITLFKRLHSDMSVICRSIPCVLFICFLLVPATGRSLADKMKVLGQFTLNRIAGGIPAAMLRASRLRRESFQQQITPFQPNTEQYVIPANFAN